MRVFLPLVFTLVLCTSFAADAADRYEELRAACSNDAWSLCSWTDLRQAAVGNYKGVAACFHKNHKALSGACHATLSKYGYR